MYSLLRLKMKFGPGDDVLDPRTPRSQKKTQKKAQGTPAAADHEGDCPTPLHRAGQDGTPMTTRTDFRAGPRAADLPAQRNRHHCPRGRQAPAVALGLRAGPGPAARRLHQQLSWTFGIDAVTCTIIVYVVVRRSPPRTRGDGARREGRFGVGGPPHRRRRGGGAEDRADARIPRDSAVRVAGLSFAGEQYVDFRPTGTSGPYLTDGAEISVREPGSTPTPRHPAQGHGRHARADQTRAAGDDPRRTRRQQGGPGCATSSTAVRS